MIRFTSQILPSIQPSVFSTPSLLKPAPHLGLQRTNNLSSSLGAAFRIPGSILKVTPIRRGNFHRIQFDTTWVGVWEAKSEVVLSPQPPPPKILAIRWACPQSTTRRENSSGLNLWLDFWERYNAAEVFASCIVK